MTIKKYKILFADDDVDFCLAVKEFFHDSHFDVDIVQNGVLALDKAIKNKYDIIILDVNMPFMKGSEAARDIKSMLPKVPVIAITGIYQEDNKHKLKSDGFDDVFIKPIKFQTLTEQIDNILNKNNVNLSLNINDNVSKVDDIILNTSLKDNNTSSIIENDEVNDIELENNESDIKSFTFAYLQKLSIPQLIAIIQEQQVEKLHLSNEVKSLKKQLKDLKPF